MVRMLSDNVCPKLPDTGRSFSILDRALTAAQKLQNEDLYPDLTAKQLRMVRDCIKKIETRKEQLTSVP